MYHARKCGVTQIVRRTMLVKVAKSSPVSSVVTMHGMMVWYGRLPWRGERGGGGGGGGVGGKSGANCRTVACHDRAGCAIMISSKKKLAIKLLLIRQMRV